jgi:hypothetical protein
MSWILMRVRFRDLDQNHDGHISIEEARTFIFKNLTSASLVSMSGIFWGIVASRHYCNHDLVRYWLSSMHVQHVC